LKQKLDNENKNDNEEEVVQPLAPEASLAAESLAMDQKYKEKDRRSRAVEPLSPRLNVAVDKLMDGTQDSSSKPH